MAELPVASVGRVVRRAGDVRMSLNGKEILRDNLETYAYSVALKAVTFAAHAGRKTVKAEDIALAAA